MSPLSGCKLKPLIKLVEVLILSVEQHLKYMSAISASQVEQQSPQWSLCESLEDFNFICKLCYGHMKSNNSSIIKVFFLLMLTFCLLKVLSCHFTFVIYQYFLILLPLDVFQV